ncbi:hypothetical protein HMPREF9370_0771 [Neisseria wadsworthii 9715]|uniref:Uncharacterized protein n=1 Tax=Neisseria wadsworthii 9715 TaxID=1030841 RepID=G4CNW2_9NEIS|nr:hypothetical protein HMPREF9370_0771 [Neisseria wadsworthii 9715]
MIFRKYAEFVENCNNAALNKNGMRHFSDRHDDYLRRQPEHFIAESFLNSIIEFTYHLNRLF